MNSYESLNEKLYNVKEHLNSAIKRAEITFDSIGIAHPFFMDLDSISLAIEDFPNARVIMNNADEWEKCQLVKHSNGKMILQDLLDLNIKGIFRREDTTFIITNEGTFISKDGIHFGEYFFDYDSEINYGSTLKKNQDTYFYLESKENGSISSLVLNVRICITDNSICEFTIMSNTGSMEPLKISAESDILGIFKIYKWLLIVTSTNYFTINISKFTERIIDGTDYEEAYGHCFLFMEPMININQIDELCYLCKDRLGEIYTLQFALENGALTSVCNTAYRLNMTVGDIGFTGKYFIIYNRNTCKASILSTNEFSELQCLTKNEEYDIYLGWEKDTKLNNLRGTFRHSNYFCIITDNDVWICPQQPCIQYETKEIYMLGICIAIPSSVREYGSIWATDRFIYILNSVGDLYCMRLPDQIPSALFASKNAQFINGFYTHAQRGAIGRDVEGVTWRRLTESGKEKSDLTLEAASLDLSAGDVQTAYACGVGMVLIRNTLNNSYCLYQLTDRNISTNRQILEELKPFPDSVISPNTHTVLIAATNNRFYLLTYEKKSRNIQLISYQYGIGKTSVKMTSDNNLQSYMEAAEYMIGYNGILIIVMNSNGSSNHHTSFSFNPELPIVTTYNGVPYDIIWKNNNNSTPNIYVFDNQIVDNRPFNSTFYCQENTEPGFSVQNMVLKINANSHNAENTAAIAYTTHAIGRASVTHIPKFTEEEKDLPTSLCDTESDRLQTTLYEETGNLENILYVNKEFPDNNIRGELYRLSNAILYLDAITKVGLITYDGINWIKLDSSNFPEGYIKYLSHIGDMNIMITTKGIYANGTLKKVDAKAHVYTERNVIKNNCLDFHHTFSFSPSHVIMELKMKCEDKREMIFSFIFSDGEIIGEKELKKCFSNGTDMYWNEDTNNYCTMLFNGKTIDISFNEQILQGGVVVESSIIINALS